jgi:hypothetical protein
MRSPFLAICVVLISLPCVAGTEPSLGLQFIGGPAAVSFSMLVPYTEGEKRVENVKVTCDEGKCRVRVESISYRACEGGMTRTDTRSSPSNEMIQINDYGPDEKDPMFRPSVTPGGDDMLMVRFVDSGQDVRLRVLLRWQKSPLAGGRPFLTSGGVVGEEEIVLARPIRFAPVAEIVGAPIICHARFQSR